MIWLKKRSQEEKYRALIVQYKKILSKLRKENEELNHKAAGRGT